MESNRELSADRVANGVLCEMITNEKPTLPIFSKNFSSFLIAYCSSMCDDAYDMARRRASAFSAADTKVTGILRNSYEHIPSAGFANLLGVDEMEPTPHHHYSHILIDQLEKPPEIISDLCEELARDLCVDAMACVRGMESQKKEGLELDAIEDAHRHIMKI